MDEKLKDSRFYKWIVVQAYKHDGQLHRQWSPAYLVEETEDYWALASRASFVIERDGRRWMTKEHAIFFLFKKEWMNVICMLKEDGKICYYVNIASPTLLDDGYLKYIDYDLDVKLFPDGLMKELDIQEFERHVLTYGYSNSLTRAIKNSMHRVIRKMKDGAFPFQDSEIHRLFDKFFDETRPFVVSERNYEER